MDVDMPDLDFSSRDFEVNFEEDAPTAKVSDAVNYDHQSDETKHPATTTSNSDSNPDANSTEHEPAEAKRHDQPVIENGDAANADANQLPPADSSDPDSNRSPSISEVPAPIKNDPPRAATSPKRSITFEFDSADPDDVDLSQSELDEMTQTSPIENVMGSVDLESELESGSENFQPAADSEQLPEAEADLDADLAAEPTDRESRRDSLHLEGGLYTDKHWKWTNSRAIDALQRMLDFDKRLSVYQCDIKQITSVEIEEFSVRWFKKQNCVVYLISHLDEGEIKALVRAKRWDERIGHPQAVTMFLALSPRRIVSDFFASIQACLLFSEDLELLRESDSLDP